MWTSKRYLWGDRMDLIGIENEAEFFPSGTVVHRSRLDLRMWFIAAEEIISAYAESREEIRLIGHSMAKRYGISYPALHRLKKILIEDLSQQPGGGLIGACVCVRPTPLLRDPKASEEDWRDQLRSAMQ